MKENNFSHKLRYERYLELIYKCFSNYMYTELTCMKIPYKKIIYVYEKAHMTVVLSDP